MSPGAHSLSPPPPVPPPKPDLLRGWIKTTEDAVLVFEATRVGIVPRVTRRFHELEKRSIIKSGAILVFTEEESGIKRWTDPYIWSASRTQGDFLMYRERENENLPDPGSPYRCSVLSSPADDAESLDPELEYYILGSWNKGKGLKKNGLMKKTISMTMDGTTYHLISYYYPSDVRSGVLRTPSSMPHLASLSVSPAILQGISHSRQSPLNGKKKGRPPRSVAYERPTGLSLKIPSRLSAPDERWTTSSVASGMVTSSSWPPVRLSLISDFADSASSSPQSDCVGYSFPRESQHCAHASGAYDRASYAPHEYGSAVWHPYPGTDATSDPGPHAADARLESAHVQTVQEASYTSAGSAMPAREPVSQDPYAQTQFLQTWQPIFDETRQMISSTPPNREALVSASTSSAMCYGNQVYYY